MWKSFALWRLNVKHHKIVQAKNQLSKNLFFIHPILRRSLLSVRALCVDFLVNMSFLKIQNDKVYELVEFIKEQKEWVDEMGNRVLKDWEMNIRHIAEKAGVDCLKEKGFSTIVDDGSGNSFIHVSSTEIDVIDTEATEADDSKNTLKMAYQEKKALEPTKLITKKLTYTEQAARRTECRRLQRFLKLIDYMIVSTLHNLTVESVNKLLITMMKGCNDTDVLINKIKTSDADDENYGLANINDTWKENQKISNLKLKFQVGGIILGPEVSTSELMTSGYDGFPNILTRIKRRSMTKIDVIEVIDDTGNFDGNSEMELQEISMNQKNDIVAPSTKGVSKIVTKPFTPLFRIELFMRTDQEYDIYLSPSLQDFVNSIDYILKAYISSVQNVKLIANTIYFLDPASMAGEGYLSLKSLDDKDLNEGPDVTSIILDGGFFREVCGRIRGTIVGMFLNMSAWMNTWEDARAMWISNESFNSIKALEDVAGKVATLMASPHENSATIEGGVTTLVIDLLVYEAEENESIRNLLTEIENQKKSLLEYASTIRTKNDESRYSPVVDFFEKSLIKFSSQRVNMAAIPNFVIINNFNIDTTKMKETLIPSPERCFFDVANILPCLARDKNEILLNEVQIWLKVLGTEPTNVEAFVEYLGWLEKGKLQVYKVYLFTNFV